MTNRERKQKRSQHQATGAWIRTDKRLAIYLRDRFACIYCLRDHHDADPSDITLDHIVCRSDGGSNTASNLVTACRECNCARGDTPISRFAGPETRKHIRRNTRRSLRRYRRLAKAILAGELEYDADLEAGKEE